MNRHLLEDEIAQWVSGERMTEVGRHLRECSRCAAEVDGTEAAFALFRESGREWSEHWRQGGAYGGDRAAPRRRPALAMAACAAMCAILALLLLHPKPAAEEPFVAIPYVAPLAPYERVEVVRMDVPVAELAAAGLEIHVPDTGATVLADVVLGQDGRAHAIRLVANGLAPIGNESVTQ